MLFPVSVHGVRSAQLRQPGLPHLHRLHASQEGAVVRAAGGPRHVHHHQHGGD